MPSVTSELVGRAIVILGAEGSTDAEVESKMLQLARDPMLARRLIDWPPEAFGLVLIPHIANVRLPKTFSAKSKRGDWIEFPFRSEPIFEIAVRLGTRMYHNGPRSTFENVVLRGALLAVVNRALQAGSEIDGSKLSGPALIGIPAEVYAPKPEPFWRRFFR